MAALQDIEMKFPVYCN